MREREVAGTLRVPWQADGTRSVPATLRKCQGSSSETLRKDPQPIHPRDLRRSCMSSDDASPPSPPGENKPQDSSTSFRTGLPGPRPGLSADDLIILNEEIAGMARAGLPLDQGLAVLAREMGRGRLQQV